MRTSLLVLIAAACSSTAPRDGHEDPKEAVALQRVCPDPAPSSSTGVSVAYDLTYSSPDGQEQRLDIAWPDTGTSHPLVVLIHGGSWAAGSRSNHHADMMDLARRGYVAASVDYRLTRAPQNIFPAAVRDVRCAVRWLRSERASYSIDTSRVAAAGFSAGGHLASMLGVNPTDSRLTGDCTAENQDATVDAVISYAGPQDLRVNGPHTVEQGDIVTNFLGAYPGDVPEIAALASPITAVREGVAPFLLIHGTRDGLVPVEQSRAMRAAVRSAGGKATILELSGLTHAFVGFGSSPRDDVRCTTVAFLNRWLRL